MKIFVAAGLSGCLLLLASASTPDPKGYATRTIEGFTVYVESSLAKSNDELGRDAIAVLSAKLLDVRRAVPERALVTLRTVPIWLDRDDPKFPCAVYHPSRDWLIENGCDPRKARAVHIANARTFLDWTHEQPAMVLHELAHAFHDRMSAEDRALVDAAHARGLASGAYAQVLRASGVEDRHYALENPAEFFAEASEAWFGTNDFYPFVRAELERHDPQAANLVRTLWSR
jgi:hypothetical protein